jgi:hypothetical protein
MNTANRFNLASNHLQIGEMINPEEKDEQRLEGAFHKFPSEFYEFRPFKMVADLTYSHDFVLPPKVSTLVSLLVDYQQDKDRLITRDAPNYVDGSFHTTCTRGFFVAMVLRCICLHPATIHTPSWDRLPR